MRWLRDHLRFAVFGTAVVLQALVLMGAVAREEYYLRSGQEIRVQTAPVDPFDLLRGQYLVLSYGFQQLPRWYGSLYEKGDDLYVVLVRRGRYWVRDGYEDSVPSRSSRDADTVYLRGRVSSPGEFTTIELPDLSRYYLREGTREPREPPDVILSVRNDGTARIVRLEIDGRPWP